MLLFKVLCIPGHLYTWLRARNWFCLKRRKLHEVEWHLSWALMLGKKKKRANTGLRLLSLERPAYKWPLDAFWEFDWHIGPDTDGTLFLNDKDGSWVRAQLPQLCSTLCESMDCAHQDPLSMEFSRQEYWSGLSFHTPEDLQCGLCWTLDFTSGNLYFGYLLGRGYLHDQPPVKTLGTESMMSFSGRKHLTHVVTTCYSRN